MFGKLIDYKVQGNSINIDFEGNYSRVDIISPTIINIFSPIKCEQRSSRAIETLNVTTCTFEVDISFDQQQFLFIKTELLTIKIYDDFKVDFYDRQGALLCQDYRAERSPFPRRGNVSLAQEEGHSLEMHQNTHKIEIVKKLFGDEKFYGLGDKTGHFNKRGYYYEMWNIDDPSPHV